VVVLFWAETVSVLAFGAVFDHCDDSSGTVIGIFHRARADLGQLAAKVRPQPPALAEAVLDALQDNGYGHYDGLIGIMAPVLGEEGLARLKSMAGELGRTPLQVPPKEQWKAVGQGLNGATHEHALQARERTRAVLTALKDIADAQGDVDGFIAQYDPQARKVPQVAAEIAQRLLAVGRAGDALGFIERAEVDKDRWIPRTWQDSRLEVLEALGRKDEAQAFRRECFELTLLPEYLSAYLKRLPDFEDIDAEERAMDHAAAHAGPLPALAFFLDWPAPERAARLLIDRHGEINGDRNAVLAPAAEALAERHPLAATLALRAMIDFTLTKARSKRYGHAARHLAECAALAGRIEDFGTVDPHATYVARLKQEHGRKSGFWALLA